MGEEFFSRGAGEALKAMGLMADDVAYAMMRRHARQQQGSSTPPHSADAPDPQHGTPYPDKSPSIGAERFARLIRRLEGEDDSPSRVNPDNANYAYSSNLDRLTSWGSPTNVDEGRSSGGLMVPANPRG